MKLKAASIKKLGDESLMLAGGVMGAAASRGAAGLVPTYGTVAKLGIAAIALFGAASVTGTDSGSKLVKGAFVGMALEQGSEVIIGAIQPLVATSLSGDASTLKDFGKRAFGLAGAYDYPKVQYVDQVKRAPQALGNPYTRKSANGNGKNVLMFS